MWDNVGGAARQHEQFTAEEATMAKTGHPCASAHARARRAPPACAGTGNGEEGGSGELGMCLGSPSVLAEGKAACDGRS